MIDPPKTIEEAVKKWETGCLCGGRGYDDKCCAFDIEESKWMPSKQCPRKNGHGINGLYCKQHAKIVEKLASTPIV